MISIQVDSLARTCTFGTIALHFCPIAKGFPNFIPCGSKLKKMQRTIKAKEFAIELLKQQSLIHLSKKLLRSDVLAEGVRSLASMNSQAKFKRNLQKTKTTGTRAKRVSPPLADVEMETSSR